MYAENWLMFPYFQSCPQELEQFQDLCCCSPKPNASMSNFSQSSTISEYDLGGEGDLFKAPEPIIEESVMSLDPMMAAIPMISCGEDIVSSQDLKVCATESSLENEQLLFEIFYECEKDLLAKEATETPLSEVLDFKNPFTKTDQSLTEEEKVISHGQFQKSSSSGNLGSMIQMHGAPLTPNFLDFTEMDLGTAYGMRRAFSEGDIKALGNGNISLVQSPLGQPQVSSIFASEDRKEKLSRYRNKKSKRNFGRKIKYACRKALADSQPRIRGRFAKTEDIDISKKQ